MPFTLLFTIHYIFPTLSRRGNLKNNTLCSKFRLCYQINEAPKRTLKKRKVNSLIQTSLIIRPEKTFFLHQHNTSSIFKCYSKLEHWWVQGQSTFQECCLKAQKIICFLQPHFSILLSLRGNERRGAMAGNFPNAFTSSLKNNFLKNTSKPLNVDECSLPCSRPEVPKLFSLGEPKLKRNGGPLAKSKHLLYCVILLRCKMYWQALCIVYLCPPCSDYER